MSQRGCFNRINLPCSSEVFYNLQFHGISNTYLNIRTIKADKETRHGKLEDKGVARSRDFKYELD